MAHKRRALSSMYSILAEEDLRSIVLLDQIAEGSAADMWLATGLKGHAYLGPSASTSRAALRSPTCHSMVASA